MVENYYKNLLVGAEDWAIQQVEEEAKENAEVLSALVKLNCFINDLSKSNPGFLGKLALQDYAQMNEAFIATSKALERLKIDTRATHFSKAYAK
jgi:hypothetical protein